MNVHDPKFETPKVTTGPLPSSKKVYSRPEMAQDLKVPLREIILSEGSGEPNLPPAAYRPTATSAASGTPAPGSTSPTPSTADSGYR